MTGPGTFGVPERHPIGRQATLAWMQDAREMVHRVSHDDRGPSARGSGGTREGDPCSLRPHTSPCVPQVLQAPQGGDCPLLYTVTQSSWWSSHTAQ